MTIFVLGYLAADIGWLVGRLAEVGVQARRGAPGAGSLVAVVYRPPDAVVGSLVAGGGRTPEVAAALWERRSRDILDAAQSRPAMIVRATVAAPAAVASFAAARGVRLAARPTQGAGAAPTLIPAPPERWRPSAAHSALASVWEQLIGEHKSLTLPDMMPESSSTGLLVQADACFNMERQRLEWALSSALAAIEGLAPAAPLAPLAFGPRAGLNAGHDTGAYQRWIVRHEPHRLSSVGTAAAPAPQLSSPVLSSSVLSISVVVPVPASSDPTRLRRCVLSVLKQTYPCTELCLSVAEGGAHLAAEVVEFDEIGGMPASILRPHVWEVRAPADDPIALTDAAADSASGDLIVFVDPHDVLAPHALAAVVDALRVQPDAGLVYTDEDEIDGQGRRRKPVFKPDWSPDLLSSTMYMGRLLAVRRSVFKAVGGLRSDLGESAWYDLALRASEQAPVAHAPVVAYHRAAGRSEAEEDVLDARALVAALERRGIEATVEPGRTQNSFRIRPVVRNAPLVTIVVPFRDGAPLLHRLVASIRATSGYDEWELLLLDNNSWEPETAALRRRLARAPRCRVIDDSRPFNWAAINNLAAANAAGELLLFLNSDVEGRAPGWLEALVEHAQRPEVGAVGARLLYPDGRIQHAGVVAGLGGVAAWHVFCYSAGNRAAYLGHDLMVRDCTAVTGACMMVRTSVFREVGGFDERFAVCFNDVDFCLRLRQAGYRVIYTPFAELVHHESATRGVTVDAVDVAEFLRRWGPVVERDPFFNPNLDRHRPECALPR